VGCSSEQVDIDSKVTIEQGVYGQTRVTIDYGDDPGPHPTRVPVEIRLEEGAEPIATMVSGGDGFFEIPVAAGTYLICDDDFGCVSFEVPALEDGGLVRCDHAGGPPQWRCGRAPDPTVIDRSGPAFTD